MQSVGCEYIMQVNPKAIECYFEKLRLVYLKQSGAHTFLTINT